MAQNIEARDISKGIDTLTQALETAKKAAYKAGQYLKEKRGKVEILNKKALRDDLLDVDLKAENIIISILKEEYPEFGILSEEVASINKDCPDRWVVDPLDGSFNFQHGNPTFAISISLILENTTILGVVYLPLQDEMFSAIRGRGAFLNEKPIHVSLTSYLNESIVHVGDFAKDGNFYDNKVRLHDIARLANNVGRVRMIGTAATDLAFVACGRAEALVVHNALPWDIEVGRLLVSEAGGKIASLQEDKSGRSLMICSNEKVHSQLQDIISKRFSRQDKRVSSRKSIYMSKFLRFLKWNSAAHLLA
ncbi:MAG TPA: inositol monophosphatase family protein [Ktedonobacteraceae bacterium]|nr:inositol monophosphatase family protein [Ktedonobacteraceae bacterium]